MIDRFFIFYPNREMSLTPQDVGLAYENVWFTCSDGVSLNGWFVIGETDAPTLVWFHGNGGNISEFNHRLGVNIFIFDYRGYGRSGEVPQNLGYTWMLRPPLGMFVPGQTLFKNEQSTSVGLWVVLLLQERLLNGHRMPLSSNRLSRRLGLWLSIATRFCQASVLLRLANSTVFRPSSRSVSRLWCSTGTRTRSCH